MDIKIVESDRPDTKEGEDQYFLQHYRRCLDECAELLGMTGAANLFDVPKVLRRKLQERSD